MSFHPKISTFSFASGNSVALRADHEAASGYSTAWISSKTPTISADPETSLVATYDIWGKLRAGTAIDVSYSLVGGTNNTVTIDAPAAQLTAVPFGDRNGVLTNSVAAQVLNDAATITFT